MRKTSVKLVKAVAEFKILWKSITPLDSTPTITKRFSHSACIHNNSMYIFGGCTTNATSFNDLWQFDLSKRQWIRPLATGTYPVPKAYTSMVGYKDNLILYGGWTYPSASQYYQVVTMFNVIHFYNVTTNRWILVNASNSPPPTAGHSAHIRGNEMIVFGGLVKSPTHQHQIQCTNNVWVLDLEELSWRKQATSEPKPLPRYAQSLVPLDSDRFMILGGTQTLHNRFVYSDCWTLTMKGPVWKWQEIKVKNREWAAYNIWCNPACRVGDKVVCLSRCRHGRNSAKPLVTSAVRLSNLSRPEGAPVSVRVEQSLRRPLDRDQNINGKRGVFSKHSNPNLPNQNEESTNNEPIPGPSSLSTKKESSQNDCNNKKSQVDSVPQKNDTEVNSTLNGGNKDNLKRNKWFQETRNVGTKIVRQLQEANKYRMAAFACDSPGDNSPPGNDLINQRDIAHLENRHAHEAPPVEPPSAQPAIKKQRRNTLTMHVLDISTILNERTLNYVTWMCPPLGEVAGAPAELVMYSLVRGNGELIMFGGVHNDIELFNITSHHNLYSNAIHFITPPRDVI
ncbi:F-box only protein 42 [Eumeta japonica]|uniref:F-box only protein 42 n=1 Tax=Eumeta variegata TaxID=151549 RepID=A0A4C1UYY4_EUMVA|nr:F-box only protein 42 [Eumeta japonica]